MTLLIESVKSFYNENSNHFKDFLEQTQKNPHWDLKTRFIGNDIHSSLDHAIHDKLHWNLLEVALWQYSGRLQKRTDPAIVKHETPVNYEYSSVFKETLSQHSDDSPVAIEKELHPRVYPSLLGAKLISEGVNPWEADSTSTLPLSVSIMLTSNLSELLELSLKAPGAPSLASIMETPIHPSVGDGNAWNWLLIHGNQPVIEKFFEEGGVPTKTMVEAPQFFESHVALKAIWNYGHWTKKTKENQTYLKKMTIACQKNQWRDGSFRNFLDFMIEEQNDDQNDKVLIESHLSHIAKNQKDNLSGRNQKNWLNLPLHLSVKPGRFRFNKKDRDMSAVALTMISLINTQNELYLLSRACGEPARNEDNTIITSHLPSGVYRSILGETIQGESAAGLVLVFLLELTLDSEKPNLWGYQERAESITKEHFRFFGFENGATGEDFKEFLNKNRKSAEKWIDLFINKEFGPSPKFNFFTKSRSRLWRNATEEERLVLQENVIQQIKKAPTVDGVFWERIKPIFKEFGMLTVLQLKTGHKKWVGPEDIFKVPRTPENIQLFKTIAEESKDGSALKEALIKVVNEQLILSQLTSTTPKNNPRF